MKLALIGCGKKKKGEASTPEQMKPLFDTTDTHSERENRYEAEDLYTSRYFALKTAYAKQHCDTRFILSAKHGIIPPAYRLSRYDVRITQSGFEGEGTPNYETVEDWGSHVVATIKNIYEYRNSSRRESLSSIITLAGSPYLSPIRNQLETLPIDINTPFDNTSGIGDQIKWLNNHTDPHWNVEGTQKKLTDSFR
jgi:hypothetical protein